VNKDAFSVDRLTKRKKSTPLINEEPNELTQN